VGHHLGLATRTQIGVCKSPFVSAGTAGSLFHAKTVQQRPLLEHIANDPADIGIQVEINPGIWIEILDHFWLGFGLGRGLQSLLITV